jgi:hypothetical protein
MARRRFKGLQAAVPIFVIPAEAGIQWALATDTSVRFD